MAKALLAALKNKPVDSLLLEGTNFSSNRSESLNEYDLETAISEQVGSKNGLVLASFSPQHVDRLVCFLRAAQRTHRTFVVDVYSAYVMYLIQSEVKIPPPTRRNKIRVFYPHHFLSNYKRRGLQKIHDRFLADQIMLEEITADPKAHLMLFRTSMLDSDFGGSLPTETLCFFSRWEGYLTQPDWQTVRKKLEAGGGTLAHMHTSGHALVEDLKNLLAEINPSKTVPMHTFEPGFLRGHFDNVMAISDGHTIEVE